MVFGLTPIVMTLLWHRTPSLSSVKPPGRPIALETSFGAAIAGFTSTFRRAYHGRSGNLRRFDSADRCEVRYSYARGYLLENLPSSKTAPRRSYGNTQTYPGAHFPYPEIPRPRSMGRVAPLSSATSLPSVRRRAMMCPDVVSDTCRRTKMSSAPVHTPREMLTGSATNALPTDSICSSSVWHSGEWNRHSSPVSAHDGIGRTMTS